MDKVLITGTAGFIGFHTAKRFCEVGYNVIGIDNLNDYYSVQLKHARLKELKPFKNFEFLAINITDKNRLDELFDKHRFEFVINLAAQAGVRYSIEKPYKYIDSNLIGFINVLEACRNYPVRHLIFASSSSVYGASNKIPFSESDITDRPLSLYAATKKSNELMAYSYASLYNIPCTGLRFFTVYGTWGRPDMSYFKFTKAIFEGHPIEVFNNGDLKRDFTYIEDVIEGITGLLNIAPSKIVANSIVNNYETNCFSIYNIGNNKPISILFLIETLENIIGRKAIINFKPMQPGDVYETFANTMLLSQITGFSPKTSIEIGLKSFVDWYKSYYCI